MKTTFFLSNIALALGCAAAPGLAAAADADGPPQAHSDSAAAVVSDTAITAKAKATLMDTKSLGNSQIHVTTTNGVVTLEGVAGSSEAKSNAEDAVKSIEGVKSVDNGLTIATRSTTSANAQSTTRKAEVVVTDSWITTKVKSQLVADSVSKGVDVGVETTHGVVALSGQLPTSKAIDHVKHITQGVKGVKSVDTSALTVGAN